ncbi:iron dicitrate transport regulator FecR [Leptospira selangorensis]|uniref:Iron dicitrate transport regulator FecR n=1 Tax=Leptospira selangorensis TaxID=2484982 RepID=A0A5F2C2R1_9LEPT|nr:FecR domain-containing protein [Leptospira selangorensis]TGM15878.1 iron dicitrate transport regulator FecR [Leptospira selangorensis]TGM18173.1 iron dicitrate transport regulator FecR [Leptospira selangorensis]
MALHIQQSNSFEDLLESYLSGKLDAAGKKQLLEIVLKDPESAAEYRKITQIQSQLRTPSVSQELENLSPQISSKKILTFPKPAIYLAAAALVFVSFGIYFYQNSSIKKGEATLDKFTYSYGDCSIEGNTSQAGEDVSGKRIVSGKSSICDVQLEGEKSVAVRAMPNTDFTAERKENAIHVSLGYGTILLDSQGPKEAENISIGSNDFRLILEGTKVSVNKGRTDSSLSVKVLEGKVRLESGDTIFLESVSSWLTKEEIALLAKEYPILFDKQELTIESGQQLAWKGLSPARMKGLKKIEDSIKASKKSQSSAQLDETLIKSLKPHVDSLPKDPFLISPKELKNSLKKILPDEKADLERKFASMVRFPPKDLKEREQLMEMVKKVDKTSITDILNSKVPGTPPQGISQEVRILYLKDGSTERGIVYQQDSFYVVLRPDGNLIIPVDAVEKIESE